MIKCKFLAVFSVLSFALLSASAVQGQTVLNAVGSSGVFATTGLAAIATDPVTGAAALCGTQFWSGPGSLAYGSDTRNAGIPHEPANIWVAWDNDTSPTRVCSYLATDSVVGTRLFLSQNGSGNATLVVNAAAQYTLGANKVAFAADSTSCAASGGNGPFNLTITEPNNSSTATATIFGSPSFGNGFANGASLTVTASSVPAFNVTGAAIGGVTQLSPTTFTFPTALNTSGSTLTDSSGAASATVAANCPGLPAAVFNALAASPHFTMAFTDIRPEDGHYAFARATGGLNPTDPFTATMGYSPAPSKPQGVQSSYSQGIAYGLDFGLPGTSDPITGLSVPAGTIQNIGAVPMMVFVSIRDATACGLGNSAFTNITRQALQGAYRGWTGATQELNPALVSTAAGCPTPLHVVEREPYSGTYNTFEFGGIRSYSGGNGRWSQENGNVGYPQSNNNLGAACPAWASSLPVSTPSNPVHPPNVSTGNPGLAPTCGNPLNIQSANYSSGTSSIGPYNGFGGNRTRAVGTGEMVAVVNSNQVTNTLGYAFYSLGTFGGKTNIRYVTFDGVDPLWPSYSGNPYGAGVFPTCTGKVNLGTFNCPSGQPTFDGFKNGNYSIGNIIRAVYYGGVSTCASPFTTLSAGCLIQAAQDQANPSNGNVRDYIPFVYCNNSSCSAPIKGFNFFRAHYLVSGVNGHNGNTPTPPCPSTPEAGGDMAGALFPSNWDVTYANWIGCTAEFTGYYQ